VFSPENVMKIPYFEQKKDGEGARIPSKTVQKKTKDDLFL